MDGWFVASLVLIASTVSALMALIGVCITAAVAIAAAYITANARIGSSRQHAIDTERLRLRFEVYERHLDRFHELADDLQGLVNRAGGSRADALEFARNAGIKEIGARSAAGRVMLPQHRRTAQPIFDAVRHRLPALAKACGEYAEPLGRPEGAQDEIDKHSVSLIVALDRLRQAVDIGADASLHQDLGKPDVERLTALAASFLGRGGKDAKGEG